jgi:hypothetical protein
MGYSLPKVLHCQQYRAETLLKRTVTGSNDCKSDVRASDTNTNVELQNAFSHKLAPLGFNLFNMLVVDVMHEFELGVWKALFIHLLRILESADKALINELDCRYVSQQRHCLILTNLMFYLHFSFRQVPTFGRDTIRCFSANMSEMKKLAARDFEDLLQVGKYCILLSIF